MTEADAPVEYDLTDWTNQARALLSRALDGEEIAHDWVAGTLQVDRRHEAEVDALIDDIDDLAGAESGDGTDTVEVFGDDDITVATDDDADEDDGRLAATEADQIGYDNDDWDSGTRSMLSSLLRSEGIHFAWEATTLVVNARDEERVDAIVEQVELSTLEPLDPAAPKVVYELDGWSEEQRATLAGELLSAGISHDWDDEDNLVVLEDDEAAVDPLVDVIDDGDLTDDDEAGDDEVDGLAAQDAMSDLFVAADRLVHDPTDGTAISTLTSASERVEAMPVPYGFAPADWKNIVDRSAGLRALVTGDGEAANDADGPDADGAADAEQADEDAVVEAATGLRTLLRSYV